MTRPDEQLDSPALRWIRRELAAVEARLDELAAMAGRQSTADMRNSETSLGHDLKNERLRLRGARTAWRKKLAEAEREERRLEVLRRDFDAADDKRAEALEWGALSHCHLYGEGARVDDEYDDLRAQIEARRAQKGAA